VLYTRTSTYRNEVNFFASTLQNQKSPSKKCANAYTYGFNGKEAENEVYGDDEVLEFGARVLDARLGRWLSVDPLTKKYPNYSPYNYVANSPILFKDMIGEDIIIYYEEGDKKIVVLTIVTETKLELILNTEIIPQSAKDLFLSPNWSGPTFEAPGIPNLTADFWGEFKSDAKMLSFSASATAVLSGVVELDIITLNENANSPDKGKTFLYLSLGAGLGLGIENLLGLPSWDVGMQKGNVEFNEENDLGIAFDKAAFTGFAFEKAGSALLFEKTWVTSYGCFDGCVDCMFSCDDEVVYSAELKGISLLGAFTGKPSVGGSTVATYSIFVQEIKFPEATTVSTKPEGQ